MVPKPDVTSYRPISLLPILSKILEKLFLKQLIPIITSNQLIPNHQFGFREKHSTVDEINRITDIVENAFEEKKICSAVFLDAIRRKHFATFCPVKCKKEPFE